MDISSSAITGAMRVGIQIISSHRRPNLEIYHQVRNIIHPAYDYGTKDEPCEIRHQNTFIEFLLINVGGRRAENIKLSLKGNLKRNSPNEDFGDIFKTVYPQMAAGQSKYLFRFDMTDLNEYPEGGGNSLGFKKEKMEIQIEYDSGQGLSNWILSLPSKIRSKRRFREKYVFFPEMVSGDFPPPDYQN